MNIDIIGATYDIGGRREGCMEGPDSLRDAGLHQILTETGHSFHDNEDVMYRVFDNPLDCSIKNFSSAYNFCYELKRAVSRSLSNHNIPLVLGGDHTISMGSISAALESIGSSMSVLWIDAHADLNTPDVSPSKNMHGMTVAALMRLESPGSSYWTKLINRIVPDSCLLPSRMAWMGLRDLDSYETAYIKNNKHVFAKTKTEIDEMGWDACFEEYRAWLANSGSRSLWISYDIDALDPSIGPASGTLVPDGFSMDDVKTLAEKLNGIIMDKDLNIPLAGMDVVEINPSIDNTGKSEKNTLEFVRDLLKQS